MTATGGVSAVSPKLRALDPDLPLLAAQAAMELDNFRLQHGSEFDAVAQLATRLKNCFANVPDSPKTKALLDSGAVSILGRALDSSRWAEKVSTLSQLSQELWKVAELLERVPSSPKDLPIEKIRDFCVALSECAGSYRQSFNDLRPSNPFRR
jgi:hypothetical protein